MKRWGVRVEGLPGELVRWKKGTRFSEKQGGEGGKAFDCSPSPEKIRESSAALERAFIRLEDKVPRKKGGNKEEEGQLREKQGEEHANASVGGVAKSPT